VTIYATVTLTQAELMVASLIGSARHVQASLRGWKDDVPPEDSWGYNIEGVGGEMAAGKHLGIYWQPIVGNPKADDCGPYQVRTNSSRRLTDTRINHTDHPAKAYIGVLSFSPLFHIIGWIWGHEAFAHPEWYRVGKRDTAVYWVPETELHPMNTMPTKAELAHAAFEYDRQQRAAV
jgi:hypothetical protein